MVIFFCGILRFDLVEDKNGISMKKKLSITNKLQLNNILWKSNSTFLIILFLTALFTVNCEVDDGARDPITPQDEYTLEEPGMWEGKEEFHLPIVHVDREGRGKVKVKIQIKNEFGFNSEHYIEKIGIFDENKHDIAVKEFPDRHIYKEPIQAEFTLKDIQENPKIKAFVKCNIHDLWTAPLFPED
jgi:desulfoferrodoxin (superoxide reductase-like protein)